MKKFDDEQIVREELQKEAEKLIQQKYGDGVVSFDFDYGDTGDDSIGVDAYLYFKKNEPGEKTDGLSYEFTPDGGVDVEVVRDCCNIIGQVVDPKFDFDKWDGHGDIEYEYNSRWIRVYLGLTVDSFLTESVNVRYQ